MVRSGGEPGLFGEFTFGRIKGILGGTGAISTPDWRLGLLRGGAPNNEQQKRWFAL